MNYRNYFKNLAEAKKIIPEGIDGSELAKGIQLEMEGCGDRNLAETLAIKNLREDSTYYSKITETFDGVEDEESGIPKVGGALAIRHNGQPIHLSKIVQIGGIGGGPATGELSGYTKANSPGDKEPITAGGNNLDDSIVTKSTGGEITNKDAKQDGPNHGGTIDKTAKLTESLKAKILKEIKFDEKSGKWVRIDEGKHKAGCQCGFCKNKGTFGKKKDKDDGDEKVDKKDKKKEKKDKKEEIDENLDQKMGPSYKTVNRQYRTIDDDQARTVQYEPEITEMIDEEAEGQMKERFNELANAPRNLSEAELSEMKDLGKKFDENLMGRYITEEELQAYAESAGNGKSYKTVSPTQARTSKDDHARTVQHSPPMTEKRGDIKAKTGEPCPNCGTKNEPIDGKYVCDRCHEPYIPGVGVVDPEDTDSIEREPSEDDLASVGSQDRDFMLGLRDDDDLYEAGGGIVQHGSARTSKDFPQNPDARWSNEIDEDVIMFQETSKKSSVSKQISKSNKGSTKSKGAKLAHKGSKTPKSGIHKKQKRL